MPSSLRAVLGATAAVITSIAFYVCMQGVVMLYDMYRFIDWVEEAINA